MSNNAVLKDREVFISDPNSCPAYIAYINNRDALKESLRASVDKVVYILQSKRMLRYISKAYEESERTGAISLMKSYAFAYYLLQKENDEMDEWRMGFKRNILESWNMSKSDIDGLWDWYLNQLEYYFSDVTHFDDKCIESITNNAFKLICEAYLCNGLITNSEVTEGNFISQIPILSTTFIKYTGLFVQEFYSQFFYYIIPRSEKIMKLFAHELFKEEFDSIALAEKNERLEAENSILKTESSILEEELCATKETLLENSMLDELSEAHDELRRKYLKLERKFNSLNNKYQNLRESIGEEQDEDFKDIEIPTEIDVNGRFVFIGKFYESFKNKILEAFPNSKIYASSNSDDINISNCDLVVCAVSYISHNFYYKVKNRCISQNVPFLPTNHRNVDLIKSDIANFFAEQTKLF